jgi:hypothetical protein
MDKAHGIDTTGCWDVGERSGHERGINAMRHHNSVFHALLKHVPWDVFERLVAAHAADWRVRRLTMKSQLVALLYGQLEGASSLREIEAGLESHANRLYHLGVRAPRRATLAEANASRPSAVFGELFAVMAARAHRPLRRALAGTTYLIDSTGLRLDGRSLDWARFSAKVCGVKLHMVYDADADRPIYAALSAARVNDITAAQQMPIEPGATYVFEIWATTTMRGGPNSTRHSAASSPASNATHPLPRSRCCRSPQAGRSCPTASAISRHAKAAGGKTRSRTRSAKCWS